jgi:hypothetical protein
MKLISENLYVAEQPLSMLGIEYGARMTVVRLNSRELVVISPISLNEKISKDLDAIGKVSFLVAPNSFHHLFMKPWVEHYKDAKLIAVPQIVKKRPDLNVSMVVDQNFKSPWGTELDVIFISGGKLYSESVFFHGASGTLILTDLCFNLQHSNSVFATFALKLYGIYKKFGPSKAVGLFMGKKDNLKKAIDLIVNWKFHRIVVAHGEILENTSPDKFRASFEKMLT